MSQQQVGYLELLRENRDFRHLMTGRFISQMGDWFNSVALFTLLLSLTGSGESVALVLIIKLLPTFFFGPLAGVVADRFNRKTIMIVTDLLRGFVVLGFLLVQSAEQVWLVYLLTVAQVVLSTFFEPAESAAIPTIVRREALISANALGGASWSVTLAFGAALGGIVTDAFGRDTAFVIDAASYFVSTIFILLARVPPVSAYRAASTEKRQLSLAEATGMSDVIEGARYLRANLRVTAVMLIKSGWGMGGGVLLLLTVFGKEIFPIGQDGGTSIGILYACRGFGALIGPMLARQITDNSPVTMRRTIAVAFFISTLFYLLFAQSPFFLLACAFVVGAHAGGSIQWVFSSVLLQLAVPNRFLGRVFALEQSLLTLTMALSTYATGWLLDHTELGARRIATLLGLVFLIPGISWTLALRRLNRHDLVSSETVNQITVHKDAISEASGESRAVDIAKPAGEPGAAD